MILFVLSYFLSLYSWLVLEVCASQKYSCLGSLGLKHAFIPLLAVCTVTMPWHPLWEVRPISSGCSLCPWSVLTLTATTPPCLSSLKTFIMTPGYKVTACFWHGLWELILSTTAEQQCSIIAVSVSPKTKAFSYASIWHQDFHNQNIIQAIPQSPSVEHALLNFKMFWFPHVAAWVYDDVCVAPSPFLLFCVIVICYCALLLPLLLS